MEWTEELAIGIAEIDDQHKKLVSMINDLSAAMKTGKGKDALGAIVDGMTKYAAYHFSTEENYFVKFQYIDSLLHKKEHKAFVEKVGKFQTDFKNSKVLLTIDILNFLQDWLVNHILKTDKKYAKTFTDNGLK